MPRGVCLKMLLQGLFALCLLGWLVDHLTGREAEGGEKRRRVKSGGKPAEGDNQRRVKSVVP